MLLVPLANELLLSGVKDQSKLHVFHVTIFSGEIKFTQPSLITPIKSFNCK